MQLREEGFCHRPQPLSLGPNFQHFIKIVDKNGFSKFENSDHSFFLFYLFSFFFKPVLQIVKELLETNNSCYFFSKSFLKHQIFLPFKLTHSPNRERTFWKKRNVNTKQITRSFYFDNICITSPRICVQSEPARIFVISTTFTFPRTPFWNAHQENWKLTKFD